MILDAKASEDTFPMELCKKDALKVPDRNGNIRPGSFRMSLLTAPRNSKRCRQPVHSWSGTEQEQRDRIPPRVRPERRTGPGRKGKSAGGSAVLRSSLPRVLFFLFPPRPPLRGDITMTW
eukprot:CAMPEP_0194299460 /NCGR_PEP_ID=MMETSP0169-20130528/60734_1 /TAXON_ID=218684 /ORGANISM="Corethron pennatum, Strain L29A3" /LENGTH=119 /DNA_ID=CAMNT_0039049557 /DNA_START=27 /DNA_END=383 /DNA_ORIENTATION=-